MGELTCAITAMAVLNAPSGSDAQGGGGAASGEAITISLSELSLKKAPLARGGIQVLVDVLGVRELEATSKKASAKADGVWALDFTQTYPMGAPSKLRDAFKLALDSEAREDSEVMLIVQGLDRTGHSTDPRH